MSDQATLQVLAKKLDRFYRRGGRVQDRDVPSASDINKMFNTRGALDISELNDVMRTGVSHWYESHQGGLLSAKTEILKLLKDEPPPPGSSAGWWGGIIGNGLWAIGGGLTGSSPVLLGLTANPVGIACGLIGVAIAIGSQHYSEQYNSNKQALQKADQDRRWGDFGRNLTKILDGLLNLKTRLEKKISDVKPLLFMTYVELVRMKKVGSGALSHDKFKQELLNAFMKNRDGSALAPSYVSGKIVKFWREYSQLTHQRYRQKGYINGNHETNKLMPVYSSREALLEAASRSGMPESLAGRTGSPVSRFRSKPTLTVEVWVEKIHYSKDAPGDSWSKGDLKCVAWFHGTKKNDKKYYNPGDTFTVFGKNQGWKEKIDPDVQPNPIFAMYIADEEMTTYDPAGFAKTTIPIGRMQKGKVQSFRVEGKILFWNRSIYRHTCSHPYAVTIKAKVS